MDSLRRAQWKLEAVLAGLFAFTAGLTLLNPQWIEAFGIEPDAGDGTLELAIVVGLGVAAVLVALLSRRHYLAGARPIGTSKEVRP